MFGFVSHTHTHLGGECPHRCSYCYVATNKYGRNARYQGPLRLIPAELAVRYGEGKSIFVEHCNDLFASAVPDDAIRKILAHCCQWPDNAYVFHTKNPARYASYLDLMPPNRTLGMTAETNRPSHGISVAPDPMDRLAAFASLPGPRLVTVEPIMKFDLPEFVDGIVNARPDMVFVGADSKGAGLPEPSRAEVLALLDTLRSAGLDVREKWNLARLLR
jgi:protein gp37